MSIVKAGQKIGHKIGHGAVKRSNGHNTTFLHCSLISKYLPKKNLRLYKSHNVEIKIYLEF